MWETKRLVERKKSEENVPKIALGLERNYSTVKEEIWDSIF